MVSSLYTHLRDSVLSLAQEHDETGQAFQPAVQSAWQRVWSEYTGSQSLEGMERVEMVRNVMDLVGRDLVVSPIASGEMSEPVDGADEHEKSRFQTRLQDRLDIALTLYEVVNQAIPGTTLLEPGAVFIPLLEDLVELLSVDTWRTLWSYVETRSKRFTKDMPASRGKALPLLRTINAFLRFLPRTPADLVFRGRVHQFASSVISVADKSAINMRGDYNDIKTIWDEDEIEPAAPTGAEADEGADADVKMDGAPEKATPDFYSTLWSLQQYFASPPTLDGPPVGEPPVTPFQRFRNQTDLVLPMLFEQTVRENDLMDGEADAMGRKRKRRAAKNPVADEVESEDQNRKRGGADDVSDINAEEIGQKRNRGGDEGFFHPRYLTGRRLLEHELADQGFRRQILVQYFILFQFLLNLVPASVSKQAFTGGMPKTFVLSAEDETWVKSTVGSIREELKRMLPDGSRFEETVLSIITRERHYAQWKNDGCPEDLFEVPPMGNEPAQEAAQAWKQRLEPLPQFPFRLGTRHLSRVWARGYKNIEQLKAWRPLSTYQGLDEDLQRIEMDEEDDKATGKEISSEEAAANSINKVKLNWRALRHASHTQLRHFAALGEGRNIHLLTSAIRNEGEARAAAAQADATAAEVAEVTEGAEADTIAPVTPVPESVGEVVPGENVTPTQAADSEPPAPVDESV